MKNPLKYALLLLPLFALAVVGAYALGIKHKKDELAHKAAPTTNHINGKTDVRHSLNVSLKELHQRIVEGEQAFRWHMNVPKDRIPIIGPPVATGWYTAERLWAQGMVGLYFPENHEKDRCKHVRAVEEQLKEERHERMLERSLEHLY